MIPIHFKHYLLHIQYCQHKLNSFYLLAQHFRSQMVIPSTLKADTALPFSLKSVLGKEQRDNGWEVAVEMSDPVKVHTFALYSHDYRVGGSSNPGGGAAAVVTAAALLHLALIATLMIIV